MKDMDYFYERLLDKTNIKDFYDKLPSHLQSRFKDANKTKIIWGNVLQGYRGPSHFCNNGSGDSATLDAAYGVQEIRYWWGARKDLNAQIPIIGSLAFATGRAVQSAQGQLDWTSMYFDESNGSNVSNSEAQQIQNRNRKAISLNKKGLEALNAGDYDTAAQYFDSAYNKCSKGYKDKGIYRENKNHAEAEVLNEAGDKHYRNGNFAKAYSKYDRAYDTCPSSEEDSLEKIDANRDDAKAELDAEKLNRQGDRLFDQGKYSEAKDKYQLAMEKTQLDGERKKYKSNKNKAKSEIGAKKLKIEGDALFKQAKYGKAETKYKKALDESIHDDNKVIYRNLEKKAKNEKEAFDLKKLGDEEISAGRYSESENYYQQAYDKASVVTNRTVFEACKNHAEAELLNEAGDKHYRNGDFAKAYSKYDRAYDACPSSEEDSLEKIDANRDDAKAELDAEKLNQQGDRLFDQGKYSEAKDKYILAMEKTQLDGERKKYKSNRNKVKSEIGAKNLKIEGDALFKRGKYDEAETKYKKALDESIHDDNKVIYRDLKKKAKKEKEAFDFKKLGDEQMSSGRYSQSENYYQQAYDKASVITNRTVFKACKFNAKGRNLWQEGWEAEMDDNPDAASIKFREARDVFSKARQLDPDKREYEVWEGVSSLKLEGNDLFNQAAQLQERGNQLRHRHESEEACTKYSEAENLFRQGLRVSRDNRFQNCIDIVRDCLRETTEALQNIDMSQLNIQEEARSDLHDNLNFTQQID